MRKKAVFFFNLLLMLAALACGFNLSTANVQNAYLASDSDGNNVTDVFEQSDVFYAIVELANAPDGTAVKAIWTAVDVDGADPNTFLDEVEFESESDIISFNLSNDQLWPTGSYQVEIYLNDELDQTLTFEVEGTVAAAEEPTATPEPEPTDTPEPEPTDTPEPEPTATPEAEAEAIITDSSFTTYTDPDGYFEVDMPDSWTLEPDSASLFAGDESQEAAVLIVGTPGDDVLSDSDLQDYGEEFLREFYTGDELTINSTRLEDDGSYSYDFSVDDGDDHLEGLLYVEQRGLDTFHLLLLAEDDLWEKYQDIFNQIIGSYFITTFEVDTFLSAPLALTSFTDATNLFSIDLPENWLLDTVDGSVASVAADELAAVYLASIEIDYNLEDIGVEAYSENFFEDFYGGAPYEINDIEPQSDGSFAIDFDFEEAGEFITGLMYLEQREQFLYLLIFQAPERDWPGLSPTFRNILDTYQVTPGVAAPVSPPTPVPQTETDLFAPQAGRARLYVFNEIGEELTFTVNNQEIKIPPNGIDDPVPIDLDPGRYTFTVSIPNGSANGEVTLGQNESWAVGVRGDYAVYDPFQVYP